MSGFITGETMIAIILAIALEVGIDDNLAASVATAENPAFDAGKIGVSGDLGIMQLNPKYLGYFVERYWGKPDMFDWRNPEHNIYVGLRHLNYLLAVQGFNAWQSIMAYNCGESAVRNGTPPPAAIDYANAVYTAWRAAQ